MKNRIRWLTVLYYFFSYLAVVCMAVAVMAFGALGDEHNNTIAALWVFICYTGATAVLLSLAWHVDYLIHEARWYGKKRKAKEHE